MTACYCKEKHEVDAIGYAAIGDSIHTLHFCCHASLLDVWHRAAFVAAVLREGRHNSLAEVLEGTLNGRRFELEPASSVASVLGRGTPGGGT